ncbi:DNA-processing protein DprA [Immundisolibacter sp.]|uniref:DNA-processing protein DprA n=1 Tax=Immundisolibacter sp. TaxID=1934948 RepID=UPI003569DE58
MTPAAASLALARTPGLGVVAWRRLLGEFGSPAGALAASPRKLASALGANSRLGKAIAAAAQHPPQADLAWLEAAPDRQALFLDLPGYPQQLAQIADPPLALLVEGAAALLLAPQIAIVGSRNASPAGVETAFAMAGALSRCGLVVTSGLAEGADGAAHRGALAAQGKSLAVLGTGPDRVYPGQHAELADQLRLVGALVSEQPVGTPPRAFNFPRRNRIISGLSLGVLVVEAGARSGSLITARLAAEQGREVFAIPGGIHNPLARGCHALIREGAKLVESAADILEELPQLSVGHSTHSLPLVAPALDPMAARVLACIGDSPVSLDLLVARVGLTVAEVSTMLLTLQLDGLVAPQPGGLFSRQGRM